MKEDQSEGKMDAERSGFITRPWSTFVTSEILHNKQFIKETLKFQDLRSYNASNILRHPTL